MPIDRKRINGPENTVPYQLYSKLNLKTLKQQFDDLFIQDSSTKDKRRKDGRKSSEQRKIFMDIDVVSQAKGSAYIEVNNTKVIVSVFDPREIPNKNDYSLQGTIYCEFKYAPFSCPKRRLHQQDSEEVLWSAMMKQALESAVCRHEFPNLQVDVYALVIHNDGSALSAAITAAGIALAHAGIPMYDMITSATLSVQGNTVLIDPTLEEENMCSFPISNIDSDSSHGTIVMSYLHTHEQVSQIYQTGDLSLQNMKEGIEALQKACVNILPIVKRCLVKHVLKSSEVFVEENGEKICDTAKG